MRFDLDKALWIDSCQSHEDEDRTHRAPLTCKRVSLLGRAPGALPAKQPPCLARAATPHKSISNNTHAVCALYRLGYKGRMTGHGFRAVASTILNETGFNPDVIERQLAHCERNEIRGAYNRAEYLDERVRMMRHWSDYLDDAGKWRTGYAASWQGSVKATLCLRTAKAGL